VGADEQNKVDARLKQADGRSKAVILTLCKPFPVHKGGDDIRSLIGMRIVEQNNFLKSDIHKSPDSKNEQNHNDRNQARKRNAPHLPKPPGAIDSSRFVE